MKKKFILKVYPLNVWCRAELECYEDGELKETISINRFYDVTQDWIFIYDESGGTGYGYKKGDILRKVFIGDAEFEQKTIRE